METNLVKEDKVKELRNKYLGGDLIDFLTSETPVEFTDYRPVGGGRKVKYIFGHYFIRKLNDAFGFLWSYDIPEWRKEDNQIVSKCELTVKVPGRTYKTTFPDGRIEEVRYDAIEVKKTQFGGQEIKRYSQPTGKYKAGDIIDLANDFKGAATDGLKKCGTLFGIGLDVYGQRGESEEKEGVRKDQLDVIIMRGTKAGMTEADTLKWAEEALGCKPEKADPLQLMGLVPKLIDIAKEKKK